MRSLAKSSRDEVASRATRSSWASGITLMNWGHIVRSVTVAIGITFVVAVVAYMVLRFFASLA